MGNVGFAAREPLSHRPGHRGTIWIPGSMFRTGSDKHYPEEAPAHRFTVGTWRGAFPHENLNRDSYGSTNSAHRTTAAVIARLRATRKRWICPPAMLVVDTS